MIHIFSTDFSNPLKSMSKLWATADIIWKIAGDQSTDFNHYTKRILLSWVYLTTFACWAKDKDKTFQETRSFLDFKYQFFKKLRLGISKKKGLEN